MPSGALMFHLCDIDHSSRCVAIPGNLSGFTWQCIFVFNGNEKALDYLVYIMTDSFSFQTLPVEATAQPNVFPPAMPTQQGMLSHVQPLRPISKSLRGLLVREQVSVRARVLSKLPVLRPDLADRSKIRIPVHRRRQMCPEVIDQPQEMIRGFLDFV